MVGEEPKRNRMSIYFSLCSASLQMDANGPSKPIERRAVSRVSRFGEISNKLRSVHIWKYQTYWESFSSSPKLFIFFAILSSKRHQAMPHQPFFAAVAQRQHPQLALLRRLRQHLAAEPGARGQKPAGGAWDRAVFMGFWSKWYQKVL